MFGFVESLRNAMLAQITAQIDAGAGAGKVRIYDGVRPSTGGPVTTLLAELTLSDPSFGAPSSASITGNPVTGDTSADANGTATWFRILDSNNVVVMDGDCGLTGSGADMELNSVGIVAGVQVDITSMVINAGNG